MPDPHHTDDSLDAEENPFEEQRDPRYEEIRLDEIAFDRWEHALAPLDPWYRGCAIKQVADEQRQEAAWELFDKLGTADFERRQAQIAAGGNARRTAAPLPTPSADHAAAPPTVQLNIRLRADDHARLTAAARAVGLRPTTLARALVLNGAAQVLRDHERAT